MGLAAGQQGGAQGPDSGQQQAGGASGQISTLYRRGIKQAIPGGINRAIGNLTYLCSVYS